MNRTNPLFVDSTKLKSDCIRIKIEVNDLLLYDEEEAFIEIQQEKGELQRFTLSLNEEGVYRCRIWLNHQEGFNYQMKIEKAGKLQLQSPIQNSVATYVLELPWTPSALHSESDPAASPAPTETSNEEEAPPMFESCRLPDLSEALSRWGL